MKCDECGGYFTPDPYDYDRTICLDCERDLAAEIAPELLGAGKCPHCGSYQCWGTVNGVMTCCVTGKEV